MNKEYLIYKLSDEVKNSCKIDNDLFLKYGVKRGLRNEDGSGVLVGLTNIGNVVGYERSDDGHLEPTEGKVAGDFYWKTQIQITGNTSTLASSPRLVDLFVEWQKYKAFNLRLGEFQVPFTFESPIHPIDVGFMDNGQAVLKLTGYSDRSGMHSSNGRDIGIMAQGDFLKNANGRNEKRFIPVYKAVLYKNIFS
jgi:hypothetical protein